MLWAAAAVVATERSARAGHAGIAPVPGPTQDAGGDVKAAGALGVQLRGKVQQGGSLGIDVDGPAGAGGGIDLRHQAVVEVARVALLDAPHFVDGDHRGCLQSGFMAAHEAQRTGAAHGLEIEAEFFAHTAPRLRRCASSPIA